METHAKHVAAGRWAHLALVPVALLTALVAEAQPAATGQTPQIEAPRLPPPGLEAGRGEASDVEAPQRELLNSERIEREFGSYGIDVLESDGRYRVSNLFSVHDGAKICRTFAVVVYPERVDARFAAEHEQIVAGGSIGAVFAGSGWTVTKRNLHFGELRATPKVASLMHAPEEEPLAAHVYVLSVSKGNESLDYATIAEVHHPKYLSLEDLPRIYGAPAASTEEAPFVREVLAETEARMR